MKKQKNSKLLLKNSIKHGKFSFEKNSETTWQFNFPSSIQKIKETHDSNFLIAYGIYPSQIKCFDLNDISLKFERHVDTEIIDFQILSSNWEKIVLLKIDKQLEFQIKSGRYYQVKIPDSGVSLLLSQETNILYIPSYKNEIFRLDLENGKFITPIKNLLFHGNTCSGRNSKNNLLAFGDDRGTVKFWDSRISKYFVSIINSSFFIKNNSLNPVTAIRFDSQNSHQCFIGLQSGEVMLFDLRFSSPLTSKNMGNGLAVKSIRPSLMNNNVLTSDSKIIKIWDKVTGKNTAYIEPLDQINYVCNIRKTGFIFVALQNPYLKGKYIENFGDTPRWFPTSIYNQKVKNERRFKKKRILFEKKIRKFEKVATD